MAGHRLNKDAGDEILSEINVIPLVDISLVLLIIFMVTANFIMSPNHAQVRESAKLSGLSLPKARSGKDISKSKPFNIYINKEGAVYLDKRMLLSDELSDELDGIKQSDPEAKVLLQVDKLTPFKYLAQVLDAVSSADLKNFSIAVEKE